VRVVIPRKLSRTARDLLASYADEVGEEIHEKQTLLDRLKDVFGGRKRRARGRKDDGADDGKVDGEVDGAAGAADDEEREPVADETATRA